MALSYCSNWDTLFPQDLIFDPSFYSYSSAQQQQEATLFDIPPPEPFHPADSYFNVDSFFEPDPDNIFVPPHCATYVSTPAELEHFNTLKRQKLILDNVAVPDFTAGPTSALHRNGGERASPQSVAARQRRRKISEKTHELGKLVPGGMKMNTAEMFGAAYKYIQYLQAQVGILEFMAHSCEHQGELFKSEELHGFLESTSIQEKLYSTEKCMVPREFVRELAKEREIILESKPQALKEVKELIR